MPKYAVNIGEVQLQSDRPITQEEQERAKQQLRKAGYKFHVDAGLDVVLRPR